MEDKLVEFGLKWNYENTYYIEKTKDETQLIMWIIMDDSDKEIISASLTIGPIDGDVQTDYDWYLKDVTFEKALSIWEKLIS